MRMSRWAIRLMAYWFSVEHVGGSRNVADGLSRLPASPQAPEDDEQFLVAAITDKITRKSAVTRDSIRTVSADDGELTMLREQIVSGWPAHFKDCPTDLQPYFRFR